MALNKYYKILGISNYSSTKEIKKTYRKLATKYHPDKKTGDEEKFKQISEAYSIIIKNKKESLENLNFRVSVGKMHAVANINFIDTLYDENKHISFLVKNIKCNNCKGVGYMTKKRCEYCNKKKKKSRLLYEKYIKREKNITSNLCFYCRFGYIYSDPCPICKGNKTISKIEEDGIPISAGTKTGDFVFINYNKQPIKLIFNVQNKDYPNFYINKDKNLVTDITVGSDLCKTGGIFKLDIPTPEGKKEVDIKIQKNTKNNSMVVLKNKGLQIVYNRTDLLINIKVD